MKVKVNVELILDIPGEFQDDHEAVDMIDQELRDQLFVGCEYDSDEEALHINELTVRSYFVLAGRIAD